MLSVGIVGLPNVGKSTLFNALLKKQQALAANYPFATIEPNIGVIPVPDQRLRKLAEIIKEEEDMSNFPPIKPALVEFLDIAGLVKGASEGAGLGNKFLSHIREANVIAHVVRVFDDQDIIKEGSVDPKSDYEMINTELMLADLQTLQKVVENRKIDPLRKKVVQKAIDNINNGIPLRNVDLNEEELETIKDLFLLSGKSELVVLNVSEGDFVPKRIAEISSEYSKLLAVKQDKIIVICAKIESELSELSDEEQKQYLLDLGFSESGLERLIQVAYSTLGLISFLTAGVKEVRAWTIKRESNAQIAAGEIHTDFIKKFIKAEVVSYDDFVLCGGWKKARELGKARQEGRDYKMQDGDVVEFKIGS